MHQCVILFRIMELCFFRFCALHGLAMFCFVVFLLSLFFMILLYYAADLSLFTTCHYKY